MTPRHKAAMRAEEIEAALGSDTLPAGKRNALENELAAIADNMAEGCYSNDPDDGIDWSDCPGISNGRPYEPEPETLTFICPEMTYKLWYRNDEGRMTYDDNIPPELLQMYRDRIDDALEQAYFIQVKHPDVLGVTPGVEVVDGKLHGTLTVSSYHALSPETAEELKNTLTGLVAQWSIHFEGQQIQTDGGNLYVRFYDSNDPILPATTFHNQAYVNRHSDVFNTVRVYADDAFGCLRAMYYGFGELIQDNLYPDMLRAAFMDCKTAEDFWDYLHEVAISYTTDITSPDFMDEARYFVEQPCDFTGAEQSTMDAVHDWLTRQEPVMESTQEMNM